MRTLPWSRLVVASAVLLALGALSAPTIASVLPGPEPELEITGPAVPGRTAAELEITTIPT